MVAMAPKDTSAPTVLVLTVSDRNAVGGHPDRAGPRLVELLSEAGYPTSGPTLVRDGVDPVVAALRGGIAAGHRLIVTTGGTGFAPRDLTPEATRAVVTREVPGIAELLRREGARHTPLAALSRGVAGVADPPGRTGTGTFLVNLPGSVRAVEQGMVVLAPLLPHILAMVVGWDDTGG